MSAFQSLKMLKKTWLRGDELFRLCGKGNPIFRILGELRRRWRVTRPPPESKSSDSESELDELDEELEDELELELELDILIIFFNSH